MRAGDLHAGGQSTRVADEASTRLNDGARDETNDVEAVAGRSPAGVRNLARTGPEAAQRSRRRTGRGQRVRPASRSPTTRKPASSNIDRVPPYAIGSGIRSPSGSIAYASTALAGIDDEADDRPDAVVVVVPGRRTGPRDVPVVPVRELPIARPWGDAHPGHDPPVAVAEEPGRWALDRSRGQDLAVVLSGSRLDVAGDVERGAPAPFRVARLVEQAGEVVE